MPRRSLAWIAALAVGLAGLVWGLAALQQIFAQERAEGLASVAARQAALEADARRALSDRLAGELERAGERVDATIDDPLKPADGLYLRRGDRTIVPAQRAPQRGDGTPAADLYAQLVDTESRLPEVDDDDTAWATRLMLLRDLQAAIARDDAREIERLVRGVLAHRARYVVAAERDLPLSIAVVDALLPDARPDRSLIAGLLRDGIRGADGAHVPGAQRQLLERQERFTAADARFFAAQIASLSEAAEVASADFVERVRAEPVDVPAELADTPEDAASQFLVSGTWLASRSGDRVLGVKVDVKEALAQVVDELSRTGRLAVGDRLDIAQPEASRVGLDELEVTLTSPRLFAAQTEIARRYRLKIALGGLLGAGALGIVGLVSLLVRRERRYWALRSEFVAAVSHDLRTPLASVRVMAETLERRLADLPAAKDYPARLVREADRLSARVENVLSFNRLEGGRPRLRRTPVTVAEAVASVAEEVASHASGELDVDASGVGALVIRADAELLRLALLNLISNAIKYCERDPARVVITAECLHHRGGAELALRVRDNGSGIPDEDWQRVFTEFYRRPAGSGGERGFGLGLAICRRVMQLHGGSIFIAESSGAGTVFELRFPAEVEVR